jgi:hypothetical protein
VLSRPRIRSVGSALRHDQAVAIYDLEEEWQRKGATLSDKSARKEFGLTQDEIVAAINAGKLDYRVNSMHGNPWLRLLRREVEDFVKTKEIDPDFKDRRVKAELGQVTREVKRLRTQLTMLEKRGCELMAELGQ